MATSLQVSILGEVTSTQDVAWAEARAGDQLPHLVVAARQSAGRGRSGVVWESAPRALSASLALQFRRELPGPGVVTLTAGVAAARILGPAVRLKWPNDLMVDGSKVGGILAEADEGLVVVGLGANLWWPEPPAGWAAVSGRDPGPDTPVELARAWAEELLRLLEADAWPRAEYRSLSATIGRRVASQAGPAGLAIDVDEGGALVVETAKGTEIVASGSLVHVDD